MKIHLQKNRVITMLRILYLKTTTLIKFNLTKIDFLLLPNLSPNLLLDYLPTNKRESRTHYCLLYCLFTLIFCANSTNLNASPSFQQRCATLQQCQPLQTIINTAPLGLEPSRFTTPEFSMTENNDHHVLTDITFFYKQSMNSDKTAKALFGNYLCGQTLSIQGSHVPGRDKHALLADYFYLGDTFESTVSLAPSIQTAFVNFNIFFNLDSFLEGLYLKVYGPFSHTKWQLNAQECVINNSDSIIERGRFSPQEITDENLFPRALDFFTGHTPPALTQNFMDPDSPLYSRYRAGFITITRNPLLFHTFDKNRNIHASTSKNGFDELRTDLGYTIIDNQTGACRFYLTGAAPTENSIRSSALLFGPELGNGQHWECGAGIQGDWHCWKSENENHTLALNGNLQITHLFNATEQRTFDLKDKPLSRYMLAAELKPIVEGGIMHLTGTLDPGIDDDNALFANYQYNYTTAPVANLTTQNIKISCNAQLEAVAWLSYQYNNFTSHLGYTFWMQTEEKIKTSCHCPSLLNSNNGNNWVLLGDANTFGYKPSSNPNNTPPPIQQPQVAIPLPISDSNATITHGTSQQEGHEDKNYMVDNPHFAQASQYNAIDPTRVTLFDQTNSDENQVKISIDPLFISPSDIDLTGNPLIMSHRLFGSVGYVHECKKASPFVSVGGECDFGTFVWQWSAWTKIGVTF